MKKNNKRILARGAEAKIIENNNKIIKERIKKSYRLPQLDEKLRKQRTRKEAKLLEKASKIIPVPKILSSSEYKINLEFIKGKKLSDYLDYLPNYNSICKQIGNNLAKLHDSGIIHGDLTTSNMIFLSKTNKVYFIDFGLGFESIHPEDKAVDLHVLKEALEAKHFQNYKKFWSDIIKEYKKTSSNSKETLRRLEKVELRGRYKQSY